MADSAQSSKTEIRGMSVAIALARKEEIISQVAQGATLRQISKAVGIQPCTISEYLGKDADYLRARELGLESRLEQREEEMEEAYDRDQISRAKELLSHQRWRCEREAPGRWGAKPTVVVNNNTLLLDQAATGSIDHLLDVAPKTHAQIGQNSYPQGDCEYLPKK